MIGKAGIIALIFCGTSITVFSQSYLGLSLDIGDRLTYTPSDEGFERPVSYSGSLFYLKREQLKNHWVIDTQLTIGVLGYKMLVNGLDTISSNDLNISTSFYQTFYGQASLTIGKSFKLFNQTFIGGLGGGIAYYVNVNAPYHYTIGVGYYDVYKSSTSSDSGALAGFAQGSLQMELGFRFMVGLSYIFSFNPALHGTFEFFYTPEPASGQFKLYQRELRVSVFYLLMKNQ